MYSFKKSALVVFCIVLFSFSQSLSASFEEKSITQNSSSLFSPKLSRSLRELETRGVIDVDFVSEKNIQLKKEKNAYKIWIAPGINTATGTFNITHKNTTFPLVISMKLSKKSETDYSLFGDMYQLSLQEQSLSCESSATSIILSTLLGKQVRESHVISALPKSSFYQKLPKKIGETNLWGNPQEGFVGYIGHTGSIIAKQKLMTGYGVYEKPIAQVYQSFGLNIEILTQELHSKDFTKEQHLSYLLQKLSLGNMVQLWGDWCTKEKYDDGILALKNELTPNNVKMGISAKNGCYNVDAARELKWNYTDENGKEKEHTGLDGQHAFVLLGWKGDIKNPTHVRVWDTDTGSHTYETIEWMRKWERMDYRSIVILAP